MDKRVICLLAVFFVVAAMPIALAISVGVPSSFNINFNITDTSAPSVVNVTTNLLIANQTQTVNITANVNDDNSINTVFANITAPNSSKIILNMNAVSGSLYYANFTSLETTLPGTYNVTIFASDASGNLNNTEKTSFTVVDNIAPTIVLVNPLNGSNIIVNLSFEVSGTIVDSSVDKVIANISAPSGNSTILSLLTPGLQFNASISVSEIGNYSLIITANDTSGNRNSTQPIVFNSILGDNISPQVSIVLPVLNSTYNFSSLVTISANVSDAETRVQSVFANITVPHGSTILRQLTLINGLYSRNATLLVKAGAYNITIIATDIAGNINNTETTSFVRNINTTVPTLLVINATNSTIPIAPIAINYTLIAVPVAQNLLVVNITFDSFPIQKIILINYSNTSIDPVLLIAPATNDIVADVVKTFAIDLSYVNISIAQVILNATGDSLYKCVNFDFDLLSCNGDYTLVQSLTIGEPYVLNLAANDPGFQEKNSGGSGGSAGGSSGSGSGGSGGSSGGFVNPPKKSNETTQQNSTAQQQNNTATAPAPEPTQNAIPSSSPSQVIKDNAYQPKAVETTPAVTENQLVASEAKIVGVISKADFSSIILVVVMIVLLVLTGLLAKPVLDLLKTFASRRESYVDYNSLKNSGFKLNTKIRIEKHSHYSNGFSFAFAFQNAFRKLFNILSTFTGAITHAISSLKIASLLIGTYSIIKKIFVGIALIAVITLEFAFVPFIKLPSILKRALTGLALIIVVVLEFITVPFLKLSTIFSFAPRTIKRMLLAMLASLLDLADSVLFVIILVMKSIASSLDVVIMHLIDAYKAIGRFVANITRKSSYSISERTTRPAHTGYVLNTRRPAPVFSKTASVSRPEPAYVLPTKKPSVSIMTAARPIQSTKPAFVLRTKKVDIVDDRVKKLQSSYAFVPSVIKPRIEQLPTQHSTKLADKKGAMLAQLRVMHKPSAETLAVYAPIIKNSIIETAVKNAQAKSTYKQNMVAQISAVYSGEQSAQKTEEKNGAKIVKSRQQMLDGLKEAFK